MDPEYQEQIREKIKSTDKKLIDELRLLMKSSQKYSKKYFKAITRFEDLVDKHMSDGLGNKEVIELFDLHIFIEETDIIRSKVRELRKEIGL